MGLLILIAIFFGLPALLAFGGWLLSIAFWVIVGFVILWGVVAIFDY